MAKPRQHNLLVALFFTYIFVAHVAVQGSSAQSVLFTTQSETELQMQDYNKGKIVRNARRLMIGSTAPTCTYNECRNCKHKCRAEQVPVEGNDPMNSAYHYKCVCHW